MADVTLDHVGKVYADGTRAVADLTLTVGDGEFLVLVGPSGCGKTTALRMVAGLEEISEGEVRIGGRVVNRVPSRDRDVAMVFQSYALYPHLKVWDNIAFGLRLRKLPKDEIRRRVAEAGFIGSPAMNLLAGRVAGTDGTGDRAAPVTPADGPATLQAAGT